MSAFLDRVTPVLLTYNEAPNIGRALEKLTWAKRVFVLDSFSDDRTAEIVGAFPNAVLARRRFDRHADQWNFAVSNAAVETEWVLAMDADYILSPEFTEEMAALEPDPSVAAYRARFAYCVGGK